MTRLTWGKPGERYFEFGVDRGVLYVAAQDGVPWNGLTSVKEAPDGGAPLPFYMDGYKYLNIASSEEFKATLTAYSSPLQFGECDGRRSLSNGLSATHQPRRSFHLSYRSRIGNDIDGTDYGYKIHLVYNALAAPSSRDHNTTSSSTTALEMSWAITTMPPPVISIKPTAHFIIDSRNTPSALLVEIETILYGSPTTEARIPLPDEIIAIFD